MGYGPLAVSSWYQSESERLIDDLSGLYADLHHLAQHLGQVAGEAPYPHVVEKLRQLEDEVGACAEEVHRRLHALGKRPSAGERSGPEGRSSWARLGVLVEEVRSLLRKLGGLEARWEDEQATDAVLFRSLAERGRRHRAELGDLLARSDPHAID